MRAFDREIVDAVWEAVRGLLPERLRSHPLGCCRPRVSDRLCLQGLLTRLVTGASWTSVEAILEWRESDTALRSRRDITLAADGGNIAQQAWEEPVEKLRGLVVPTKNRIRRQGLEDATSEPKSWCA